MSRAKTSKTGTAEKNDSIGPASASVNLAAFLADASAHLHLWGNIRANADVVSTPFQGITEDEIARVEERCNVADLKATIQPCFEDDGLITDLKAWHWARIYAGSDADESLSRAVIEGTSSASSTAAVSKGKRSQQAQDAAGGNEPAPKRSRSKKSQANITNEDDLMAAAPMDGGDSTNVVQDIVIDPIDPNLVTLYPTETTDIPNQHQQSGKTKGKESAKNIRKRKTSPMAPTPAPAIGNDVKPIREALLNSGLKHVLAPSEGISYLRRSRQSDYQSLSHVRTANPPEHFRSYEDVGEALKAMSSQDCDPEVLVTITYQPIGHRMNLGKETMTLPHRLQKTVFLASQTLADIKDTLVSSAAIVPREVQIQAEADDDDDDTPKYRYTDGQWLGGGVIGINRKLYPDLRDGRADNAQDVLDRIATVGWPAEGVNPDPDVVESTTVGNEIVFGRDVAGTNHDIDPTLLPNIEVDDDESNSRPFGNSKAQHTAPAYTHAGRSMHETRISDVIGGIRLGQPCWLVQQGDDEHIFTFDEIRIMHASDPPPTIPDNPDVSIYPITTFLSRLNVSKCTICEKDPATRVTVNDHLAGVTPCPICDPCFKMLHGDEDGARRSGADVIPIMEEL